MTHDETTTKAGARKRMFRAVLVFVVALLGLGALAGERLLRPSPHNHFSHLAQGWLQGRLSLEDKPPGWCSASDRRRNRCRAHRFDDYAVLWTLTLRDGSTLRGYPCRTAACRDDRKHETWWIVGEGWSALPRGSIASRDDTWYVSFPPGPALLFLPLVAVWGVAVADVLLTVVVAACIPAIFVWFFDRERGIANGRGREHLWAAAAWTFASPACFLGANGQVWFTAQIVGAFALTSAIACGWRMRAPAWAGWWWSLAVACRPINMLFALPLFVWSWWTRGRKLGDAIAFAVPVVIVGTLVAAHNFVRFDDVFEFGHRFLDVRWQERMQETGMFSTAYLRRNLEVAFTLLPRMRETFPFVHVSVHGMALWLSAPWIVAFVRGRERFAGRGVIWLSALAMAVPSLLYQNSGQVQFSYRFAVDWLPLVLVALVFGGAARSRLFRTAVVLGALLQVYGAYAFAREPGRLFVTSPLGWPYEQELAP